MPASALPSSTALSRGVSHTPWPGASNARGSIAVPITYGTPGLAGTVHAPPPSMPAQLTSLQHTISLLNDAHFACSFALPLPTHLSMMSGHTLGATRGNVARQQQLQSPAGFQEVLTRLDAARFPTTTTAGVLEFSRPEQLVPTDHFPDH